ncbi:4Fe-4S single cluster domain-containing protein [Undibacterium curvum]|uniref:Radical SAM protein n=1 Tax=Undibacterium curvum TaxID=2762294 RepID=A0ABR7A368_9BURK|nr:4Fe-4S single cluster domain-containing protein [Undibacterium curvum]MBC3931354.1 radical SAM protein [Undibacterium curvum]
MKIAINKAHYPVTVLGPGKRIGIWLQGCNIGCKGCVSQDTWASDPGKQMTVASLLSWCRRVATAGLDGVTISGGEPFDQPAALSALLDALHFWRAQEQREFDILCYSGYPLTTLQKKHSKILAKLDALIPEPYIDSQPPDRVWRGSANQALITCSERGKAIYDPYAELPLDSQPKRIQTMLDGKRIWYIGIPARGDMEALASQCEERGLHFDQVSWRQ